MYSIKAVSQATGVSIETLRAWERRYRVVEPRRDPNGRRSYDPADIIRLRKLREATERGHPISKLAKFTDEQLAKMLAEAPNGGAPENASRTFVTKILKSAEDYQPDVCEQAMSMALALLPLRQVIEEVLTPALAEVGNRWHNGAFNITQERIVSNAARKQVNAVLDTYNRITSGPAVVFATIGEERHELGILMCALLTAAHGIKCIYLGTELPPDDLATFASRVGASTLVLSFVLIDSQDSSRRHLETLMRTLPSNIAVWIGGTMAGEASAGLRDNRLILLQDIRAYERALETLTPKAL
jgi:MerR family transcriptional regulator, light-induced transcriptional regulator